MRLYRITTRKWALDTACEGARLYGGRWNPVGCPVLYAGASIEICALEKFVHLAGAAHPPLVLVAIDLPDDQGLFYRPRMAELPAPASTQEFGRRWVQSASALAMLVPSAIIPESVNAVINARHPAYRDIRLEVVRAFTFDARMFRA
nr:RES family NAD+ phosphorylase [uncultured Noviherbaspirillum sp.]